MLRHVKIGTRLGAAVALGLGTTVVIAALGYSGVARVSNMTASMLSHEAKLASVSASARADVQAMRRFEKELAVHVGNADQEAEDLARWNDQRYRLNERLGTLERDTESAEDRDAARSMRNDLGSYETGFYRVVGLVRQRSLKATPDVNKEMSSYKDAVERLETSAADLAAANFKRMGDREEVLAAQKRWTARAMAAVMLLTIALGTVFSVRLTRGVTGPIHEAVRITEAIARGELAVAVPASGGDELGQLLAAMGRMAARLRGVVGEVRSGADALAQTSGQVVTVVGQVSSASSQVSASAQTLSQGTSEQAASVEETTSSLEEMSASITQNAENSRQMEQMALQGARDGERERALGGRHGQRDALDRREDLDRRGDRVPDEPPRPERGDRGGARRRARPRLRRRRGRGAQARRAQPGRGPGDRRPRRHLGQGRRALPPACSPSSCPRSARPRTSSRRSRRPRSSSPRASPRSIARSDTWTRSRSATPRRPRSCPRRRRRWRARPTRCASRPKRSCARPRALHRVVAFFRTDPTPAPAAAGAPSAEDLRPGTPGPVEPPAGGEPAPESPSGPAAVAAFAPARIRASRGGSPEREFRRF